MLDLWSVPASVCLLVEEMVRELGSLLARARDEVLDHESVGVLAIEMVQVLDVV